MSTNIRDHAENLGVRNPMSAIVLTPFKGLCRGLLYGLQYQGGYCTMSLGYSSCEASEKRGGIHRNPILKMWVSGRLFDKSPLFTSAQALASFRRLDAEKRSPKRGDQ